ncbi:recombinase family protein [Nesterenkonia halobia]|uniref:Recombinase family protein n=1 Tax=Nesterenkonia halobia TaxID=37922 RepID=A0ABP6RHL0_9MICC
MFVGYARCSTTHQDQDLTAQRETLISLGVEENHIYRDVGLTGANRDRPGLREALAAVRAGDALVVTKLDRLARSVPDARDIAAELESRGVALNIGGSTYNPLDPMGKLLFTVLSMVAEFEGDLIRQRTREGMAVAKARGRLRGRQPKLSPAQERHVVSLLTSGEHTTSEVAEIMGVSRGTIYRARERARPTSTPRSAT